MRDITQGKVLLRLTVHKWFPWELHFTASVFYFKWTGGFIILLLLTCCNIMRVKQGNMYVSELPDTKLSAFPKFETLYNIFLVWFIINRKSYVRQELYQAHWGKHALHRTLKHMVYALASKSLACHQIASGCAEHDSVHSTQEKYKNN